MKLVCALFLSAFVATIPAHSFAQDAADEYYGAKEMQAARAALHGEMGGQKNVMISANRLEYQSNEGDAVMLWESQAWLGGDINKLWIKTDGEYLAKADRFEDAEIQALYSRAISPYFDLQFGYRYDAEPEPERHFAVFGAQGLVPYWIELDAAAFLSDDGDVSMRLEVEYELLMTQRLILQPRIEMDVSFDEVPEKGIGTGLSTAEAGVRLRYEFRREFAPYIGFSWRSAFGETVDFVRADGEDDESVSFVAGLRFWF